ncbi:MAG: phenylacetate--CoA ligase family protein [Candidatus Lokiarchaeia archaeon]
MEIRIFNPFIETMPRSEIEQIQESRLKSQLIHIYYNSEFHQKKFKMAGVKPDDIKSLSDLKKLPLITRSELQEAVSNDNPFGGRLCVPEEFCIFYADEFPTEGEMIYVGVTNRDNDILAEAIARQWAMAGVEEGDTVGLNFWSWHPLFSVGCMADVSATNRLECRWVGNEGVFLLSGRMLHILNFIKPVIYVTYLELMQYLEMSSNQLGIPLKGLVQKSVIAIDPLIGPSTEDRQKWENIFDCNLLSCYNIRDNLFFPTECSEKKGLHAWEDLYIVEAVDPQTGEPVADGEKGKLTVTNLWNEATPILRYTTNINVKLDKERCTCGRTHLRIIPIQEGG